MENALYVLRDFRWLLACGHLTAETNTAGAYNSFTAIVSINNEIIELQCTCIAAV